MEYVETERITPLYKGNQIDSSKFSQLPGTAMIVKIGSSCVNLKLFNSKIAWDLQTYDEIKFKFI